MRCFFWRSGALRSPPRLREPPGGVSLRALGALSVSSRASEPFGFLGGFGNLHFPEPTHGPRLFSSAAPQAGGFLGPTPEPRLVLFRGSASRRVFPTPKIPGAKTLVLLRKILFYYNKNSSGKKI